MLPLLLFHFVLVPQLGVLSVFGGFLTQLCAGCYHGTFGNMLPYLTSYMKQTSPHLTHGDLAMVFSVGGMAQAWLYILHLSPHNKSENPESLSNPPED